MIKPIFHLQPETNWINDPNGLSFIGGQFHMFFQHNPHAPVWGNMTWGHAVSPDMVHWRRLPHALYPDQPYDKDGVFSGCCVVKDGLPHIIYTGVYPETVCLALGDSDGMRFDKYNQNPILTSGGRDLQGWRDPYIWPEGDGYRMIIGSGEKDGYGFVEMYESNNLYRWTYIGRLAQAAACTLPDIMWECPMFLLSDDSGGNENGRNNRDDGNGNAVNAALFVSAIPASVVRTITGYYANSQFVVSEVARTDEGDCLYAPALVRHPDGRWIMFGWLTERGDEEARKAQGWQGMLSLPRELWLEKGRLRVRPAKEAEGLRGSCIAHAEQTDAIETEAGQHHEIFIRYRLRGGKLAIELLRDDAGHCVKIVIEGGGLTADLGEWSGGAARSLYAAVNAAGDSDCGGKVGTDRACGYVRIFTDGTAIELYGNDMYTLTTRAYPHADATGVRVKAIGGCVMEEACIYLMENSYT